MPNSGVEGYGPREERIRCMGLSWRLMKEERSKQE
jgi:hypothetical protein